MTISFLLQFTSIGLCFETPGSNVPSALDQEVTQNKPCRLYVEFDDFKGFGVREFNRVDGFALSYGITVGDRYEETAPSLDAAVLYYTDRKRAGWLLDLHKTFESLGYFTVGVVYTRKTVSYDVWRMGNLESSLASFVLKEAFRNYYERQGFSLYFTTEINDWFIFKTSFTREDHRSLESGNPFTIPGGHKIFRRNPAIDDGKQSALAFSLTYDSRDNIRIPHTGWFSEGTVEISKDAFGSDFSYTRWFLNFRRYHPLGSGHFINTRVMAAGTAGHSPTQRLLTAGGVGTLRGYEDNSLCGDHAFLANIEYRFPIGLLKLKPVLMIFNELNGMLFLDTGRVWYKDSNDRPDFLTDIGIGLSGANFMSYFGLYAAWPMTEEKGGPRITIKIERDF